MFKNEKDEKNTSGWAGWAGSSKSNLVGAKPAYKFLFNVIVRKVATSRSTRLHSSSRYCVNGAVTRLEPEKDAEREMEEEEERERGRGVGVFSRSSVRGVLASRARNNLMISFLN